MLRKKLRCGYVAFTAEPADDHRTPLTLSTREIAEKFLEPYWRQVEPFQFWGASEGLILRQTTGQQAKVINRIAETHRQSDGLLYVLMRDRSAWNGLVGGVDETVRVMPLGSSSESATRWWTLWEMSDIEQSRFMRSVWIT